MNTITIEKKFEKMGAKVEFEDLNVRNRLKSRLDLFYKKPGRFASKPELPNNVTIDVEKRGKEEVFIIDDFENKHLDLQILDARPDIKHLLLMVKDTRPDHLVDNKIAKFLCGHDERHWFVAAIPEAAYAKNVLEAMDALKPEVVSHSQNAAGVKTKHKNKRKNKGYIRQGEWFFVPTNDVELDTLSTHKNEPISRGNGASPHICEELCRRGGVTVYVHTTHAPRGFTQSEFDKHIKANPKHRDHLWSRMTRDAEVFVRGYVKHQDHATITLSGWHKVIMNLENKAKAKERVVFLD